MKKIWLFLSIVLLMPASAQPQKKCDKAKNFCSLKSEVAVDTAKIVFKSPDRLFYPNKGQLGNYLDFFEVSDSTYQKKCYPKLSLWTTKKSEDSSWKFMHLWLLEGYIGYRHLSFWNIDCDYPRSIYWKFGNWIFFNWTKGLPLK